MNKKIVIGTLTVLAVVLASGFWVYTSRLQADGGQVVGSVGDNQAQVLLPKNETSEVLGGAINTQAQSFPNWSCVGDRCEANITFSIQGGEYFKLLTNTAGSPLSYKGKTVYVDYIEAETPIASTTMRLIAGTTTQSTLNPYLNPGTTAATTTFFAYTLASTTASGIMTYPASSTAANFIGISMATRRVPVGTSVLVGLLAGGSGIPSAGCSQACGATSSWRFSGSDQSVQVRVHAHAYLRQN